MKRIYVVLLLAALCIAIGTGCATILNQTAFDDPGLQKAYEEWLVINPQRLTTEEQQLLTAWDRLTQPEKERINSILKDCSWLSKSNPTIRDKVFMMTKAREILDGLAAWSVLMPTT
jgi:hypothetical protein